MYSTEYKKLLRTDYVWIELDMIGETAFEMIDKS
jgi:hypothetical protein